MDSFLLLALLLGFVIGFLLRGLISPKLKGWGDVLKQDTGSDNDAGKAPDEQRRPTCEPRFLFHRQSDRFYRRTTQQRINSVRACDDPASLEVPQRVSIPIYWAVVGTQWTEATAGEKVVEAATWFERYCVFLTRNLINLRPHEAAALQTTIRTADTGDPDVFAREAREVYEALWGRIGRPRDLLVILFLDSFQAVRYGDRVDRVAGNFESFPLILIPGDPDIRSRHIVTHELIHGLGKQRTDSAMPPSTQVPGSGEDRINTWDEAGCTSDMGNAERTDPSSPLIKGDDDMLDWASYYQFVERAGTVR